jgi:simple sugar transport system permease protein
MEMFIIRCLEASAVLAFAALGELINQRSGILNVGVEGLMLFGATLGFITVKLTGNFLLGFLVGMAIGGVFGLLHGFLSIALKVDQVVSGMGIWILGFGLTTYIGQPYTGPLGMGRVPTIAGLSPFVYIVIALLIILWFILFKTSFGLRIRSVGENPSVAEVSGISVTRTRYICVAIGGALGGLSGAIFALVYNPVWNYNLIMGWGFVAFALVFFSMWNPLILLGAAFFFGTLWQLSVNPQLVLPGIMSRYIWRMVPFILTVVVLSIISTGRFRTKWGLAKPAALGLPYTKE